MIDSRILKVRPGRNAPPASLLSELRRQVVGQDDALSAVVPYLETHRAGLSPEGRPAGVFLLLGPTGTGKTRTVEALADAIHSDPKSIVKINCGEFQLDHEVAKLIGAPPGYLGHRETQPMLTQGRLAAATSSRMNLSLVLFDEIEKAAPSMVRLLMGVLDKATLRLGDGTSVNFERSLIFFTSNLGARNMQQQMAPQFGFTTPGGEMLSENKLRMTAEHAMKQHFPPEFVNRIDATLTYRPLRRADFERILNLQLEQLQKHIDVRLMARRFQIDVRPSAREFLLDVGCSREYGARELRRAIDRLVTQPLAVMVVNGMVPPGSLLRVEATRDKGKLSFRTSTRPNAMRTAA